MQPSASRFPLVIESNMLTGQTSLKLVYPFFTTQPQLAPSKRFHPTLIDFIKRLAQGYVVHHALCE
jgi:hypothetical protein